MDKMDEIRSRRLALVDFEDGAALIETRKIETMDVCESDSSIIVEVAWGRGRNSSNSKHSAKVIAIGG